MAVVSNYSSLIDAFVYITNFCVELYSELFVFRTRHRAWCSRSSMVCPPPPSPARGLPRWFSRTCLASTRSPTVSCVYSLPMKVLPSRLHPFLNRFPPNRIDSKLLYKYIYFYYLPKQKIVNNTN